MKWYVSLIIILILGLGFYFHLMTFDPVTFILLGIALMNNHNLMQRQEQTALLIKKSHEVTAANHKAILDALKQLRAELKFLRGKE